MELEKYIKKFGKPTRMATLCFLFRKDEILLAMKKRGFGMGRYNGPGGKPNEGELIDDTAKREVWEEIGVKLSVMEKMAELEFYFLEKPDWNQKVIVFVAKEWKNSPAESEEMKPEWFRLDKIPYDKMWPDDRYWLPQVILGKKVKASFLFGQEETILDQKMEVTDQLT